MLTSPLLRGGSWSQASRLFLGVAAIQAILNVSFEGHFIARLVHSKSELTNEASLYIVYDSGFIVAQLFAFALSYAALHVRSQPLATAATAFDLVLLLFHVAQLVQTGSLLGVVGMQATSIAIVVLGCVAKAWLIWRHLNQEFGWQVYRALGADLKMQRMFLFHQILLSLVTLTAFFFLELWLQLATITAQTHGEEGSWVQNIFILAVCVIILCLTLFSAVQELPWLMYCCSGVLSVAPVFFIYKLVKVNHTPDAGKDDAYQSGRKYLTFFLALLLILDVALLGMVLVVGRTFGKGLRQRLRHFQILARGEVDLETISRLDRAGDSGSREPTPGDRFSEKKVVYSQDSREFEPAERKGLGSTRSMVGLVTSAKGSLKESSMLFRAFFSGLNLPLDAESIRSRHREDVKKWEGLTPGLANPALLEMLTSPPATTNSRGFSTLEAAPESPTSSTRSYLRPVPATCSSSGFGTKSTMPCDLTCALSAEELSSINGTATSTFAGTTVSTRQTAPRSSFSTLGGASENATKGRIAASAVSRGSLAAIGSAKPSGSPGHPAGRLGKQVLVENYADDCHLYNTLQRPLTLRVANPDSNGRSSNRQQDLDGSMWTLSSQGSSERRSPVSTLSSADGASLHVGEFSAGEEAGGFDQPLRTRTTPGAGNGRSSPSMEADREHSYSSRASDATLEMKLPPPVHFR
ncbi:hypothetical protein GQ54DRAFT_221120 [Martensiomyces pterosporus]|nr:hypothetical protein GQ54DRAFT_221120 [Martensiomyces pterosporus]